VEGRLQGNPGPSGRPPVRLKVVAAAVFVAALLGSAAIGASEVLPRAEDGIERDSKFSEFERRHAAGERLGLEPEPFDAFRRRLRPRDRYAVDVPPGRPGQFITQGEIVRAYSAFFFLPAIQVRDSDRVFRYRFK
jgi:hypothetical protein